MIYSWSIPITAMKTKNQGGNGQQQTPSVTQLPHKKQKNPERDCKGKVHLG